MTHTRFLAFLLATSIATGAHAFDSRSKPVQPNMEVNLDAIKSGERQMAQAMTGADPSWPRVGYMPSAPLAPEYEKKAEKKPVKKKKPAAKKPAPKKEAVVEAPKPAEEPKEELKEIPRPIEAPKVEAPKLPEEKPAAPELPKAPEPAPAPVISPPVAPAPAPAAPSAAPALPPIEHPAAPAPVVAPPVAPVATPPAPPAAEPAPARAIVAPPVTPAAPAIPLVDTPPVAPTAPATAPNLPPVLPVAPVTEGEKPAKPVELIEPAPKPADKALEEVLGAPDAPKPPVEEGKKITINKEGKAKAAPVGEVKPGEELPPPPSATPPATTAPAAPAAETPAAGIPEGKPSLQIGFKSTETSVPLTVNPQLDEIAAKMKADAKQHVLLVAYASAVGDQVSMARRVSLARALAVRAYLIDQGIDNLRINVNAAGEKNTGGEPDRVDVFIKNAEGK